MLFFPRQIFRFWYFLGYWGVSGYHISSEKWKEKNSRERLGWGTLNTCKNSGPNFWREKKKKTWYIYIYILRSILYRRLGRGTLNTCKISGSNSQKRRRHFDFCAVKCKITAWHRNYLVLVCFRFRAFNLTWTWSYEVSLSNICTKLCTNMPWSIRKRLVQKKMVVQSKKGSLFFFLR